MRADIALIALLALATNEPLLVFCSATLTLLLTQKRS